MTWPIESTAYGGSSCLPPQRPWRLSLLSSAFPSSHPFRLSWNPTPFQRGCSVAGSPAPISLMPQISTQVLFIEGFYCESLWEQRRVEVGGQVTNMGIVKVPRSRLPEGFPFVPKAGPDLFPRPRRPLPLGRLLPSAQVGPSRWELAATAVCPKQFIHHSEALQTAMPTSQVLPQRPGDDSPNDTIMC